MRSFVCAAAFLLLLPGGIGASSTIDGSWAGRFSSDQTSPLVSFVLKTDGNTLTGSMKSGTIKLSISGTVTDTALQFNATPAAEGDSTPPLFCNGTVNGDDTIKLTCQTDGQPDKEFLIKRQKET